MKRSRFFMSVLLVLGGLSGVVKGVGAVPDDDHRIRRIERRPHHANLEVQVWVDRGEGSHYGVGEPIEIYFRTSRDAHVVLYDVDTEGYVHVLFPENPWESGFVRGGRTVRLPGPWGYDFVVAGPVGTEYVEAVATAGPPRRLRRFCERYGVGWGARGSRVPEGGVQGIERVRRDLIGRRHHEPEVAWDRTYFHVGRPFRYYRHRPHGWGFDLRLRSHDGGLQVRVIGPGLAPGHEVRPLEADASDHSRAGPRELVRERREALSSSKKKERKRGR